MTPYILDLEPLGQITDEQFEQLCQKNPDINFERDAQGGLIIMPPTGGETGNRNSEINAEFVFWNRQKKLGKVFDSNTCFKLPNGAERSPDLSWIKLDRYGQDEEILDYPEFLDGEDVLPGFRLDLGIVW